MMRQAPDLLLVPFREVRHDQPDDCLHYEAVEVRGELHDWQIPAHRHEGLIQVQWLASGGTQASIDGVSQRIEAPAALVVAAGSVHGFAYQRPTVGHQITIPTSTLQQMLAGAPQLRARLAQSFVIAGDALEGGAAAWQGAFEALAQEFSEEAPGRVQALMAQATLILLRCLRHADAEARRSGRTALRDALVQRFRALLETHYREHLPLAHYAGQLGVSADHLSRACRAGTGQGALALIQSRRLLEARRLLTYTPAGVAEVAAMLGYDDAAYFSKVFRRATGCSPGAFREAVHQGIQMP